MPSVTDFMNSICVTGEDIMLTPEDEKAYVPYVINRGLSNNIDTIMFAATMNLNPEMSKRDHYDFLRLSISKKRRYGRWVKQAKTPENVTIIRDYYKVSLDVAMAYAEFLTVEQIQILAQRLNREDEVTKIKKEKKK